MFTPQHDNERSAQNRPSVRFPQPVFSVGRSNNTMRSSARTKNAQSLKKLRRSNYILERILSEQKLKESKLESNFKMLEETLKRTKSLKLKSTVRNISANVFLLLVCLLLWGNWIMFSPHLDPIVMACLVTVLVSDVHEYVMTIFTKQSDNLNKYITLAGLGLFASISSPLPSMVQPLLVPHVLCIACIVLVLAKVTSVRTMTAVTLTLAVLVMCVLPLVLIFKSCAEEMDTAKALVFTTVLREDDYLATRLNQVLRGYAEIDPKQVTRVQLYIKTNLFDLLVTSQSAFELVSNFSNLTWSFGTFAATLFSLLQLDLARIRQHHLVSSAFSPFSAEDNLEIYNTVRTSTKEVFVGLASIGLANGFMTYLSLWAVHSPLLALPAFAASVLAVLPLFGSYLAVLPFVVGFYLAGMEMQALFIASVHMMTMLVINPMLLSASQGGSRFLGGLPIVAGLYAFGLGGIVFGPLIVGLSGLTAKIYSRAFHGEDSDDDEDDNDDFEQDLTILTM